MDPQLLKKIKQAREKKIQARLQLNTLFSYNNCLYILNPKVQNDYLNEINYIKSFPEDEWHNVGICYYDNIQRKIAIVPMGKSVIFTRNVFMQVIPSDTDRDRAISLGMIVPYFRRDYFIMRNKKRNR